MAINDKKSARIDAASAKLPTSSSATRQDVRVRLFAGHEGVVGHVV